MPAILTLTMNPALDVSTSTARVEPTHKLRCAASATHPGGGGINVARVLSRLGADVLALYPAGGRTGRRLGELLDDEGVAHVPLPIAGETRESFSVLEDASGQEYRFVLPGPRLAPAEWQACLDRTAATGVSSGIVVASGSLPPGTPADFYARLARVLAARGIRLVLDSSGPALAAGLEAGVYLVKPSLRELHELTGLPLDDHAQRLHACGRIIERGEAQVVALSLGAQGALVVDADEAWQAAALPVPVASTIGAGDSFVAGLVWGLAGGSVLAEAFRCAMAASAAALASRGTALARAEEIRKLLQQVEIRSA